MATPTVPDITEMSAIHRVFRKSLDAAPRLIGTVADGDRARAAVVGGYYANVLEFLRVHHGGEDVLLFPRLHDRVADVGIVERMTAQHEAVHGALDASVDAVNDWKESASTVDGEATIAALAALADALIPHLDAEEEHILPLIEEHITVEEWGELPGHAMGNFAGDNLFLILGLVRDEFTQEQRDHMLESMPPPAVEAWQNVGINAYAATIKELVGAPA